MSTKTMKAGDLVYATDHEGRKLLRKAVEISGDTVYLCTQEEFELALAKNQEPICVGFNVEFVQPCHGT